MSFDMRAKPFDLDDNACLLYTSESNWESFTVTCKGNRLLKMIENYSGNIPGSGALMTFKDSSWRMSLSLIHI